MPAVVMLVILVLWVVLTQDPASRPALEAKETALLEGTLFVRLPVAAPAPGPAPGLPMDSPFLPFVEQMDQARMRRPGSAMASRAVDGRGFTLRAVQMAWRASPAFRDDVQAEVARWEKVDPHRRRFAIEPLKLDGSEAFAVVPSTIADEGRGDASNSLPTTLVSATNLVVFLARPDRLVQEIAFYQAADAPDQTTLSRQVAATLRVRAEAIDTSARRVELHLDAALAVPDGWLTSVAGRVDERWLLLRKIVPCGQAAPSLAIHVVGGPASVLLTGPSRMFASGCSTLPLGGLDVLASATPGRLVLAAGQIVAAWAAADAMREVLREPFADLPLAGGAAPAGAMKAGTWFTPQTPPPNECAAGIWAGAPDEASWAEVEALMKKAQAALGARLR